MANAEEDSGVVTLDAVTSEVHRTFADIGVGNFAIVDDRLARWQATDLADVFLEMPSIRVGGGASAAQKIYIRGLEDKLANVTIDGATQGGYLNHHQTQIAIEPSLIKAVNVEPGVGPASQGPGALAGSIRFETKTAADFMRESEGMGGYVKTGYSTAFEEYSATAAGFGQNRGMSYFAAFTYRNSDDYEDGNGDAVPYSANEEWHFLFNGSLAIDDNQQLKAGLNLVRDEGDYLHRPNFAEIFAHPIASNLPVFIETSRDTYSLGYALNPAENEAVDFEAKLFFNDFVNDRTSLAEASYNFPPPLITGLTPNRRFQYESSYESIGIDLENRASFELAGSHVLVAGANLRQDTGKFVGGGIPRDGFIPVPAVRGTYETLPDEELEIVGFFVQDTIDMTEQTRISIGARFDKYDYQDYEGQTFDDTGISPNVRFTVLPSSELELFASYASVFRGVLPHEAQTIGELPTPNSNDPSVDPEWAEKFEIGVRWDNGTLFAAGVYSQNAINDVIGIIGSVRDNIGELKTEGYEATLGFRNQGLTGAVGVSQSEPKLNGQILGDTAFGLGTAYGRRWSLDFNYAFEALRIDLGWLSEYVEELDNVPPGIPPKESYDVHSLYAVWQPIADRPLFVDFTVRNITDEYYLDHTTTGFNSQLNRVAGLPEAGRDFRLSVSYQF